MSKTIHRRETQLLIKLLWSYRVAAGVTQTQLSAKLGRAQSFISDVERGQRRLDLVQLRDLCAVLGVPLGQLVNDFEQAVDGPG